ncbi:MAG: DUF58 domain-containing protein, partial [Planctomycetota bacterium]
MQPEATPNFLDPQTLAAIKTIDLRARIIVEGLMSGQHRSPQQGISVEFAQHRQYTPGDDTRFLDWKIYGKTDKLYLKQYQQETNLDLVVLLDCSGSMGYTSLTNQKAGWTNRWTKWNHAACVAAAMTNLALRQQDRVSLTLFADDIVTGSRLSNAQNHWKTIAQLLHRAELVKEENNAVVPMDNTHTHTDLELIVDRTVSRLTRRSLVVLVSDLFDDPAHLEKGLARLHHRNHDVIILQVMDPAELGFDFRDASEFFGLEGEGRLPLDPAALRETYLEVVDEHLRGIETVARKFNYDYLLLNTQDALGPPLSHFLARRSS